ncbi:DEAD/DEAH box helicase [Paenibacillus thermotolerans]|uniref:DEAD/DEAH box helicase n=1 Tax=Paenibacillus thermotolerans TaxID=3027807 RepID=UPI00236785F0|nr:MULTISPECIES: DEAD/DEAH box helicase [unclassified Paenibacillus]
MENTFVSLGLRGIWSDALAAKGILSPAPIQSAAIPSLLEGSDAVIRSGTGTGKTLAYLLPVAERLNPEGGEQAIVLAPTAELAMQIVKVANDLFAGTSLRALGLIGGAAIKRQIEKLKEHPELIVGTPGRIVELLKLNKLKTHGIRIVVVDEADQTFSLGAGGEADFIMSALPKPKQIVFCSATMPEEARALADRWMNEPHWIEINGVEEQNDSRIPSTLEHLMIVVEERDKIDAVRRLLRTVNPAASIVFVNDTERVAETEAKLKFLGLPVTAVYGDQPKLERAAAMRSFRDGRMPHLIATDVAARGIDAPNVTHVIHFDPPTDAKAYLHRAGRTGRMGKQGTSIVILTPKQRFIAAKMAKELNIRINERVLRGGALTDSGSDGGGPEAAVKSAKPAPKPPAKLPAKPEAKSVARNTAKKTAASSGKQAERPSNRHRDKKNKGAPRWLKEKRAQDGKEGESGNAAPRKP